MWFVRRIPPQEKAMALFLASKSPALAKDYPNIDKPRFQRASLQQAAERLIYARIVKAAVFGANAPKHLAKYSADAGACEDIAWYGWTFSMLGEAYTYLLDRALRKEVSAKVNASTLGDWDFNYQKERRRIERAAGIDRSEAADWARVVREANAATGFDFLAF
jgi:hypothetical protein